MEHLAHLYKQHPGLIIVTPTTPNCGWPIKSPTDLMHGCSDGNQSIRNMEYVWLANFCGCPCLQFPVGYADPLSGKGTDKMPIGLMGMSEWGSEDALIEWGYSGEAYLNGALEGGRRHPPNWVDVLKLAGSDGASRAADGGNGTKGSAREDVKAV